MAWELTSLLPSSLAGALGFVGGAVANTVSREAKFNTRIDVELTQLRAEVALCRDERTQFAIVRMGVRMILPELKKLDENNPVLVAVAAAFSELDPEPEDFASLLKKLEQEAPDERDS